MSSLAKYEVKAMPAAEALARMGTDAVMAVVLDAGTTEQPPPVVACFLLGWAYHANKLVNYEKMCQELFAKRVVKDGVPHLVRDGDAWKK